MCKCINVISINFIMTSDYPLQHNSSITVISISNTLKYISTKKLEMMLTKHQVTELSGKQEYDLCYKLIQQHSDTEYLYDLNTKYLSGKLQTTCLIKTLVTVFLTKSITLDIQKMTTIDVTASRAGVLLFGNPLFM